MKLPINLKIIFKKNRSINVSTAIINFSFGIPYEVVSDQETQGGGRELILKRMD